MLDYKATFNIDTFGWGTDYHVTQQQAHELACFSEHLRTQIEQNHLTLLTFGGDLGWQNKKRIPFLTLDTELVGLDVVIAFVRGNHDLKPTDVVDSTEFLKTTNRFLDIHQKIIKLNEHACMIGHNGAPDFRSAGESIYANANFRNTSPQAFPEFEHQTDIFGIARLLRHQADEATDFLLEAITEAFKTFDKVYVLTHYPPLREVCLYDEKVAAFESCGAIINYRLGQMLLKEMSLPQNQMKSLEVLCGHTHTPCLFAPLPNLVVRVGKGLSVSARDRENSPPRELGYLPNLELLRASPS